MTQPPWNQPWGGQPPYPAQGYPPGYPPQGPPPQGPPPQAGPQWQPNPNFGAAGPPAGPPAPNPYAPTPSRRSRRTDGSAGGTGPRRRPVLLGIAAGAVLLVVGGVAGYVIGRSSTSTELNTATVAGDVQKVLESDYGVANVSDMSCPDNMEVKVGAKYTCTFTAGSAHATVQIVISNDAGQYVVQGPKA